MAFGSDTWLISAIMRFSGNGASFFNQMGVAAGGAERKVDRVTMAMTKLRGAATMLSGAFAAAMVAIDIFAVKSAASLQRTLMAIRNETGASPAAMRGFYNSAFSISNIMGVAPTEGAKVLLDISRLTAGQLSTSQMQAIAPKIAGFASTINFNRPDVSVEEATKTGLQLIHLFRAYTPGAMTPLLDQVYRLSGLIAESPSQALRQMTYYEPLFKGVGVDDKTSVAMMALLDRAGFRNRVGTGVRAAMLEALGPAKLTSHAAQWQMDYLGQMGLFSGGKFAFNTKSGGVDWIGMLTQVNKWAMGQEAGGMPKSKVANLLFSVFGKQGGNIMELMADPVMIGILKQIRRYQGDPNVSLAAGQRNRENTLAYQSGRAWGNVQAVVTELAYRQLPALTSGFRSLADAMHNTQQWLHQHPRAEGTIAGGLGALTALAAARFAGGMLYKGLDFIGAFAGMKGAGGATVGIGKKILLLFDNVFTAGFASRLAPVFGRFFGFLFRLLPAGAGHAIPIVGWIATLAELPNLMARLPSLLVPILNWWNRSKYGIGFAIGNAFGTITSMLIDAIKTMAASVSAGAGAFLQNIWMIATPLGMPMLQAKVQQAMDDAFKHADRHKYPGFFEGLGSGTKWGLSRDQKVEVHMGGQNFSVTLAPGTTSQQAAAIVKAGMHGLSSAIRSYGSTLGNPVDPRVLQLEMSGGASHGTH